jgi:hypothetical protein
LYLKPKPSRLLNVSWWSLHALLIVAAALVGWPWPVRAALAFAALSHAALCRPRALPTLLIVGKDGSWRVPEWGGERLPLAAQTRLTALGIDLYLGIGPGRRHLVLLADQLDRVEWVRLNALLRRAVAQA